MNIFFLYVLNVRVLGVDTISIFWNRFCAKIILYFASKDNFIGRSDHIRILFYCS